MKKKKKALEKLRNSRNAEDCASAISHKVVVRCQYPFSAKELISQTLTQGHTTIKWQSQDMNSSLSILSPVFPNYTFADVLYFTNQGSK